MFKITNKNIINFLNLDDLFQKIEGTFFQAKDNVVIKIRHYNPNGRLIPIEYISLYCNRKKETEIRIGFNTKYNNTKVYKLDDNWAFDAKIYDERDSDNMKMLLNLYNE